MRIVNFWCFGRAAWLLAALFTAAPAFAAPLKIIAIGDSITQGGKLGTKQYTYRWPLSHMLRDEQVDFDFIGTRTEGLDAAATWPAPWDAHHEGFYGATSAFVRDRLREDLPKLPPPDVALIDLGSNDAKDDIGGATIAPLRDIVEMLRARNPKVAVYVALIPERIVRRVVLHTRVRWAAHELSTAASPVVVVDQDRAWNADPDDPAGDTVDGVHPNLKGQRKMAEAWLSAMRPALAHWEHVNAGEALARSTTSR